MQKFGKIITGVLLVLFVIAVMCTTPKTELLEDSRKVADSAISFYTPDPKIAEGLNEVMTAKLTNYLKSMKQRDDAMYVITIDPDAKSTVQLEDTDGIEVIGDTKLAIKVNDLIFSDKGYAEVVYKGVSYAVAKEDVEETYQMLIHNPVNAYKYVSIAEGKGEDKDTIVVTYKSEVDNSVKNVQVRYRIFSGLWDFNID